MRTIVDFLENVYRMRLVKSGLLWIGTIVLSASVSVAPAFAQDTQSESTQAASTLRWANRYIATFRVELAGVPASERAQRARTALDQLDDAERREPVSTLTLDYQEKPAVVVRVGDRAVLILRPGDSREPGTALADEANLVQQALASALNANQLQRRPRILALGIARTLGGAALAWLLFWICSRVARRAEHALQQLVVRKKTAGANWVEYLAPMLLRLTRLTRWLINASILFAWLLWTLGSFPLTQPLAEDMHGFLGNRLVLFARSTVDAAPGLATVALILFLTRAVIEAVALFFDNIHNGRIQTVVVHRETAMATKRIVSVVIWVMGLTLAYPYIPGSDSNAFKGISLLIGLMVSLGSAGAVNQLMSGFVVIYSRALLRGDVVRIGDVEARVEEIGGLATKLVDLRGREITIPNSVLIGQAVHNYSRPTSERPVLVSAAVSIGYDAPWRVVHRLLLAAADSTDGLSKDPAPFVLQRSLDDFYVSYEIYAAPTPSPVPGDLKRRGQVLSDFHANIQDAFNAEGIQIMSPHFEHQPAEAIVVPREAWSVTPHATGKADPLAK